MTYPNGQLSDARPPENYLVWAILSLVLGFWPLGVAAVVFSSQVNSKWMIGDLAGALESSRKAKKYAIASAVTTAAILVAYVAFIIILIAAGLDGPSN